MSGTLLDRARKDFKRHVSKGGWEEDITLSTVDGSVSVQVKGFASKHWFDIDSDGLSVSSKNAHICLIEDDLVAAGYPVRDSRNEVSLKKHRVSVKDSTGIAKEYVINDWRPDETLGGIVCFLGDYDGN